MAFYDSTTFNAKFWPSQSVSSIFLYPGQEFFILALFNFCVYFLILSSHRVFGLPVGLFAMGFQECIALTILVSGTVGG
jgi:hypothetical protein